MPSQGVIVADEAIGREIRQLREDTKNGLAKIESGLDRLLPREVYSANHEALKRRVEVLERDIERIETAREHDAERAETERANNRRWLIASIVVPVATMTVTIILAVTT